MTGFKRNLLFFSLLILPLTSLRAAAIPDGGWNGKLWPKKELLEGAQRGDKDALAEWAYCSLNVFHGFRYDEELIFKRAKLAAEKGSLLGLNISGYCYCEGVGVDVDLKKGISNIRKAAKAGHPQAQFKLLILYLYDKNFERKVPDAIEKMEKLREQGVWGATRVLGHIYSEGTQSVIDNEKAAACFREVLEKHSCHRAAYLLFRYAKMKPPNKSLGSHFSKESLQLAVKRVNEAADLGAIRCVFLRSFYQIERGNPHLGVPAAIQLANRPRGNLYLTNRRQILSNLMIYMTGRWSRHEQSYAINGDILNICEMANTCYEAGNKTRTVMQYATEGKLLPGKQRVSKADEKKGVKIIQDLIKNYPNYGRPHNTIGNYFLWKHTQHDGTREEGERGMAHLVYNVFWADSKAHWIMYYYLHEKKVQDLPKGVATAEWAVKRNRGAWLKAEQHWLNEARKKLTPEQRKEADRLVKEGFPHSDKFRKAAFEYLQKVGDIPADRKFKEDDGDDEDMEDAQLPRDMHEALALMALLMALPEGAEPPLFTAAENKLMDTYLSEGALGEEDLKQLTALITDDDKKLKALLSKHSEGRHAARVKELTSILGNEHTYTISNIPLDVTLGWYLIYEKKKVTSIPYITRLEEGGIAKKAGMHVGDAIEKCSGYSLRGAHSRNLFVRLSLFWPKKYPMKLDIRRGLYRQKGNDKGTKTVNKQFALTLKSE